MSRKFIATVLAASMAVTAFTAMPARAASEQDIARLLAGAATIFIITKAIQNSRENDNDRHESRSDRDRHDRDRHDRGRVIVQRPDRHEDRYRDRDDGRHSRDRGPAPLPEGCQVTARTRSGHETLFGARCLDRHYRSAQRLPGECLREVRSYRGERQAYSGSCLRHRGYSVASR